jgi:osmotically-inducible protein OsmY
VVTRQGWRGVVLIVLAVAGCSAQDGDILRKIARKTAEKVEVATVPVGQVTAGKVPVVKPDMAARVAARLQWDRYVGEAGIEVRGQGEGVVVLAGKIDDPSVKQRALDLAKSTVGVERVTDELTLTAEKD